MIKINEIAIYYWDVRASSTTTAWLSLPACQRSLTQFLLLYISPLHQPIKTERSINRRSHFLRNFWLNGLQRSRRRAFLCLLHWYWKGGWREGFKSPCNLTVKKIFAHFWKIIPVTVPSFAYFTGTGWPAGGEAEASIGFLRLPLIAKAR